MWLNCKDSLAEYSLGLDKKAVNPATTAKDLMEGDIFNTFSSGNLYADLSGLQWLGDFSVLDASGGNLSEQQLGGTPASPLSTLVGHGQGPEIDNKTNTYVRPPYSFATLICMAMQESKKSKITLCSIYTWLTDNFYYYRHANPTWKNTIRHTLTQNRCFIKVPRQEDEPGKGGFWKVDPDYAARLLTRPKMRWVPPVQRNPAHQIMTSQPVPTNVTSVLHVSPVLQQLLDEFEEVTGHDQAWDPQPAETDSRSAGRGRKRKHSGSDQPGRAKVLVRSSSPLLPMEEPKVLASPAADFDWDALLDSFLNEDVSLYEISPLSPVPQEQDLVEHGIDVSTAEISTLMEMQTGGYEISQAEADFLQTFSLIEDFL